MGANSTYITAWLQDIREILHVRSAKEIYLITAMFNKDLMEEVECLKIRGLTDTG